MPVTKLDPCTALIVIDLQKGIAAIPCVHPMADVVRNASALAAAFRRHGLPVVLVNALGAAPGRTERKFSGGAPAPDWAELLPELDAQPGDYRVSKRTWGAFTNTDLDAYLKSAGVTQVVVCGVATSTTQEIIALIG